MSAEAVAYVWRHSPYTGAQFTIHLAVADTVNDQYHNEFWALNENVATKARTTRETVNRTMSRLVDDGYLTVLNRPARGSKEGVRYRFEFPVSPVRWGSRRHVTTDHTSVGGVTTDDMTCDEGSHERVTTDHTELNRNSKNSTAAPADSTPRGRPSPPRADPAHVAEMVRLSKQALGKRP